MNRTLLLELHLKDVAKRPQRKNEETITKFDRNIFWYNQEAAPRTITDTSKVTYEDHRKAIETAVNLLRKETQHDIAMCILSHRYFETYRGKVFKGKSDFYKDYSFLVSKIGMVFNPTTSRVNSANTAAQLREYSTPTLVQVNHIVGSVTPVNVSTGSLSLNEWAINFNLNAPESTTYQVAGLKLGA